MSSYEGKRTLRLGIFGGSFDPPHIGHLVIAKTAMKQLRLDRILFVPAYLPPHKRGGTSASAGQRLTMVRLALRGRRKFVASDVEVRRRGVSFTAVTLKALRRRFPTAEFWLMLGSDNAGQFHTWKSSGEIAKGVTLVVYKRPGSAGMRPRGVNIVHLKGPALRISSSTIRKMVARKRSVRHLVPRNVLRFISTKKLYGAL